MPAQKYTHIYEDLKKKVESGQYMPQTCLPTEFELVDMYQCSRNTVRRAVAKLSEIGYVQSIHGKGVIVIYEGSRAAQEFPLENVESLKEVAARLHKSYATRVLYFTTFTIDDRLSRQTGFPKGEEAYYMQRVRYLDGEAVILDNNWFLCSVAGELTPEIAADSVYEYMETILGEKIVTSKRTLTVEKVTEIDEKYLNLGDYNCMAVITSRTFNADGVQFEYTQSRHRPDQFEFSMQGRRWHK